jgi:hypothetical protein
MQRLIYATTTTTIGVCVCALYTSFGRATFALETRNYPPPPPPPFVFNLTWMCPKKKKKKKKKMMTMTMMMMMREPHWQLVH